MPLTKKHLHSIDALRGFLAFLGILLHAGLFYMLASAIAPHLHADIKPHPGSLFFNGLVVIIHIFRMPAFYLIAGFFSYLTLQKWGVFHFIHRRFKRITIPFLIFLVGPSLPILMYALVNNNSKLLQYVSSNLQDLSYLWFLYYLMMMYVIALMAYAVFCWMVPERCKKVCITRVKELLLTSKGHVVLAIITGTSLAISGYWFEPLSIHLQPDFSLLFRYCLFFFVGWSFAAVDPGFMRIKKYAKPYLLISAVILVPLYIALSVFFPEVSWVRWIGDYCYAGAAWLLTLGIIGVAVLYFNQANRLTRYLADASYWTYLVQMPLIVSLQFYLSASSWNMFAKYLAVVLLSYLLCLGSYQLLIRHTPLKKLF